MICPFLGWAWRRVLLKCQSGTEKTHFSVLQEKAIVTEGRGSVCGSEKSHTIILNIIH